jgi:hypothetical protein
VATVDVGKEPGLAAGFGRLYELPDQTISRIDMKTNTVTATASGRRREGGSHSGGS